MIITIGRQHGSGGHDIARALARELQIRCYDKEIVDEAARCSKLCREVVDSFDEKRVAAFIGQEGHFLSFGENFGLNMRAAAAQFDAIRSLAEQGDAIFVGRCADYVLRGREDLLRVFIMGDLPRRIETVMARYDLGEEQAKKLIREVDKDRSSFYRYYTDQLWGEAGNYDLCIDSGRIGVDGAVHVIVSCLCARGLVSPDGEKPL